MPAARTFVVSRPTVNLAIRCFVVVLWSTEVIPAVAKVVSYGGTDCAQLSHRNGYRKSMARSISIAVRCDRLTKASRLQHGQFSDMVAPFRLLLGQFLDLSTFCSHDKP